MRALSKLALLWSLVAAHALAMNFDPRTGELMKRQERPPTGDGKTYLPPPTQDPWYRPPEGWEAAKPGAVLKTRPHAHPTIAIRNCIDTFQVLYRSTDTNNDSSWAVSTVFIPKSHENCTAGNPDTCAHGVVSYQVPTDSADPDAAPSYLLQARDPYGEMRDLLGHGWFVAVPDYEGPLASFMAGVQSAHAILDGGRAVMSVAGRWGLRADKAKLALWGYSGGAFATEFAAELAGSYAPDLKIAGAAVGGSSPNLTTVTENMNRKDTVGLIFAGLAGITMQQPAARRFLLSRLRANGTHNATAFMRVTAMTGLDALYAFAGQDVYEYFVGGRADVFSPVMQDLFDRDAQMGAHGVPSMPCFYYKAAHDEMSPVEETDRIVDRFCAAGANILYHRNAVGGHNDELWYGRLRLYEYLKAVLDGRGNITIPEKGCLIKDIAESPDIWTLFPDWYWTEGFGTGLDPQRQGVF